MRTTQSNLLGHHVSLPRHISQAQRGSGFNGHRRMFSSHSRHRHYQQHVTYTQPTVIFRRTARHLTHRLHTTLLRPRVTTSLRRRTTMRHIKSLTRLRRPFNVTRASRYINMVTPVNNWLHRTSVTMRRTFIITTRTLFLPNIGRFLHPLLFTRTRYRAPTARNSTPRRQHQRQYLLTRRVVSVHRRHLNPHKNTTLFRRLHIVRFRRTLGRR